MNNIRLAPHSSASLEAIQARFAFRVAARLTEQTSALPQDVSARLRFAREQALARAQALRTVSAPASGPVALGSSLAFGGGAQGSGRWVKFAAVLPLVALVAGLVLIEHWHRGSQIAAAAEIDALLLSDDLPPAAYSDPGFVEFLKTPRD